MTPEEVRLVMNGWLENQSQLALVGQLWGFALALRCRVGFVSDETVGLITSDGGKVVVGLSEEGTKFKYSEMREFSELARKLDLTPEQRFASSLMLMFPPRDVGADLETLYFAELID
jgi:hypothetical protein